MFKRKKQSHNENEVSFIIPIKTALNLDLLNDLSSGRYIFSLSCSYQGTDSHHTVIYDTGNAISLKEWYGKNEYLLKDFLLAMKECVAKEVPLYNIVIESEAIFVQDDKLKLVLLPIENQKKFNCVKMFRSFIKLLKLPPDITKRLLSTIKTAQSEIDVIQLLEEDELLKKADAVEQTEVSYVSDESETTFLSLDNEAQTTVLTESDTKHKSCDETVLLDETEQSPSVKAYLVRNKTGERIPVTKPLFTIGKMGGSVDYAIYDNPSVSRQHASIVIEYGNCFIIDNNSTNGTYLEGAAIQPLYKTELENGALITVGDENLQIFMGGSD